MYYTSWWDFVGIKIEIVGMDPNCSHPKPRPSTPHNFVDTSLFLYRKETWTFKSNFIPTKSHQVFSSAFHFICWSWDFGVINDWTTRMEKWKLTKTAVTKKNSLVYWWFVVCCPLDNVHTNDMLNGMLNTFLAMPVALDFTLVSKVSEWVGHSFKLA